MEKVTYATVRKIKLSSTMIYADSFLTLLMIEFRSICRYQWLSLDKSNGEFYIVY